jgi:hypothetical protein
MQTKLLTLTLSILLIATMAGCTKTSTGTYPADTTDETHLSINQNRQFENGYTSNNPVDRSDLP